MRAEHQKRADSAVEFTTGNYGVTTTSSLEWLFVVEPSESALRRMGRQAWASEDEGKMPDRSHCRQPESLEAVLERCAAKNALLAKQGEPQVIKEEAVAARLYTGPVRAAPLRVRSLAPRTIRCSTRAACSHAPFRCSSSTTGCCVG